MAEVTDSTPVAMLTVGQLRRIFEQKEEATPIRAEKDRYVYGYAGIAQLFNCSIPTAAKIKLSGTIDGAVKQIGRKIIVDSEKALELASRNKRSKR